MDIPPEANSSVWAVSGGGFHSMAIYGPKRRVVEWPPVNVEGDPRANGTLRGPPAGLTDVVAVAAGQDHSLALRRGGKVVMWTRRLSGGDADVLPRHIARANVRAISAAQGGGPFSLFLLRNGSVIEWPVRNYSAHYVARPDALLASGRVKAVAAGWEHALALLDNGTVVAWGGRRVSASGPSNSIKSVTVPPAAQANVVAIAAGRAHSLALLANGSVVAWGTPLYSSSGASCAAESCKRSPPPPAGPNGVPAVALSGVKAIAAGRDIAVALLPGGRVFVWGPTYFGLYLHVVPPEAESGVIAIAGGSSWWLAVKGS
ncbi:hypothetical protein GPECTOR_5g16 [Gonium pectorale]|uniref:Uncharacterized protein n=1 Tax=Gonium pectorale TaxID=33097 RepID=A0A150GW25_GONPE|nr:hypothetical protein GPECTOR_5g16 [Gonium pectorale]|eukprot:KXZ54051.1 hypothetical protein GPECTOR_5g16 [Gonium pectorale]